MILLLALSLRLVGINQSLWLDEAISVNVANNYSYEKIVTEFSKSDFHPPLYYLSLKSWSNIFGTSEMGIRMLSVLFSLGSIYIVFLLAGKWPALLLAVNPLFLYYSQEARMYSMVSFLLIVAIYFFRKEKWFWVSIFLGLSFATFYGSVFLMVALAIYLLAKKKFKEVIIISLGPLLALGVMSPLLKLQIANSKEMLAVVSNWDLVLGKANIKNLLLIPMKFAGGRISFQPKILYYLSSGLLALYVFGKTIKKDFFSFIFWMSLGVGTLFSIFTPMMQYFRFLYLIPIMVLSIKKDKVVLLGFLLFSLLYLSSSNFYREDWKSLSGEIDKSEVYMVSSFYDPVSYYRKEVNVKDIRGEIEGEEIIAIPYGEEIHGVDHEKILREKGYKLSEKKSFRELEMERWVFGLE